MTDEQILKRAIEKAMKNGFKKEWRDCSIYGIVDDLLDEFHERPFYSVIFSRSFAEAFWGDDYACPYCGGKGYIYGDDWVGYWKCGNFDCDYSESFCTEDWEEIPTSWQYHLTKMVLKENPLQYLEKFL